MSLFKLICTRRFSCSVMLFNVLHVAENMRVSDCINQQPSQMRVSALVFSPPRVQMRVNKTCTVWDYYKRLHQSSELVVACQLGEAGSCGSLLWRGSLPSEKSKKGKQSPGNQRLAHTPPSLYWPTYARYFTHFSVLLWADSLFLSLKAYVSLWAVKATVLKMRHKMHSAG